MYESNFPPPPPQLEVRKHSPLGIISFVLAIVSLGIVCAFFIYAYILGTDLSMAASAGASIAVWAFICGISVFTLTGLGLGIAAVVQPAKNKVFGILGIVFNTLILIGFCLFILFAVYLAASSAPLY